ncbi:putative inorganic phosphate cotransporter [Oppia nitens]|uniref:putative inorganic phosphate cotransporter n=1 Tax=Oppia nitens TaxID=1686743 RepID=UPI0023DA2B5C|nr:putative inorganic phosphate cotransporter [Oppia nitens]
MPGQFNNSKYSSDACNIFNEHGHITDNNNQQQQQNHHGEFDWSESTQSQILGAFFYGYLVFQIVGGRLAEMFGAKWLCAGGQAGSMLINVLTPVIARTRIYWLLVASRVVLGMFQAFILPSLYALFSKWVPDHERSTFLAFMVAGSNVGTVTTNALSGYLAEHGFAGGWPSVFYVSAIICSVWLLVWSLFITSEPTSHPCITNRELLYIKTNINGNTNSKTKLPVPWKAILLSKQFLALIIVKFCVNWSNQLFLSKLPTYLQTIFNYPIEQGMLFFGMQAGGDIVVVIDMTNNFTATVFGIANTIAYSCGFITPLVIGYIIDASPGQPRRQWSYIFYMSAAISIIGGCIFLVFGTAERQSWDRDASDNDDDNNDHHHS